MKHTVLKYLIFVIPVVMIIWYLIPAPITPLMEAAKHGDIGKLQQEIESHAKINRKGPEGLTALMFAARNGQTEAVSLLLLAGADPNVTSNYQWTALMFASTNGYGNVVEQLLKAGANPNINSIDVPSSFETVGDYPETNALAEAIKKDVSVAKTLLKYEAIVDKKAVSAAVWSEDRELLEVFWERKADFSESICSAINLNVAKTKSLKWLLEKGVNPNTFCTGICESTSMYFSHLGEEERRRNDALQTTKLLVQYKADPDISCDERAFRTPLRNALSGRNIELTKYLLVNGADPNMPILYGKTVLFDAYDVESAKLLIAYGADKNHTGDNGWNAAKSIQQDLDFALEHQPGTTSEEYVKTRKRLIKYLSK